MIDKKSILRETGSASLYSSWIKVAGAIPILILLIMIILLRFQDSAANYESPILLALLNTGFLTLIPLTIAFLAARSHKSTDILGYLIIGCGFVIFGVGSFYAGWVMSLAGGPNPTVTLHNLTSLFAGFCQLAGARFFLFAYTYGSIKKTPVQRFEIFYPLIFILISIMAVFAFRNDLPLFFDPVSGPSEIRQIVLGVAIGVFALAGLSFLEIHVYTETQFAYWYGIGLLLIAGGLTCVWLQPGVGSLMGWTGRIAQYIGSTYFVLAFYQGQNESRAIENLSGQTLWPYLEKLVQERTAVLANLKDSLEKELVERKRMEEKLAETQAFLNNIIEQSPTSLWVSDKHGNLMRINQACRDVLQVHDEELVGKYNIFNDKQIEAQGYMPQVRNVFEKGETTRFLMTYNTADIQDLSLKKTVKVVLDVNISAILDSYGEITNAIIQHINITQLDLTEKELTQSEERYRLLATTIPEPIFLHQEGRFIFVNNAALKLFGAAKMEDLIGTPVIERIHPQYRQIVTDRIGEPDDNEETIAMIEEIFLQLDGSPVYVEVAGNRVIMNDKATTQIVAHDISERKKMMDALRESEQRYYRSEASLREAQAIAQVGSWSWNLKTQEVIWSEEMYRIFGIDKFSFTGRLGDVIRNVIHPDDLHIVLPSNAKSIAGEKPIEYRIILPDQSIRHIWAKTGDFLLDAEGNPIFMSVIAQDITERKQVEEAFRASELSLRKAQEVARIGNWELDLRTNLLKWSDEIYKLFEINPQTFDPSYEGFLNAIYPDDRALVNEKYQSSLKKREPYNVDHRLLMSDGRIKWVHEACDTDFDSQGNPLLSRGIIQDITERKQMEDALRDAYWRAESIIDGTQIGTWEWNIQTGETVFNQKWAQIIGYTLDELAPVSIKTWEKFAHPEDLKRSGELLEMHFTGELPNYEHESRMKHKDGRWVWVLDRGRVNARTSDGKPLMMFGTHQDITMRKRMEFDLQAQRDFATKIVNLMGQGLTVTDADGRFEFVNPAYARLFGYAPADLIGKSPSDVTFPDDRAILTEQRRLRQNGQSSAYESRIMRVDGSIAHVLITAVPRSLDPDGKSYGAIAVITDLTEHKQAENKLRASEEKYRTVANFTYDWEAWRAPDGGYLYNSPSCEQISGHSAAEFMNNPNLMLEITHPDDQAILIEHQRAAGEELKDQDLEIDFRIFTPGGETRWIAHSCTIVYSEDMHWLGRRESNRDITDRKRKEELLVESENRYRRLFETAKDGILIVDAESGMIKDANPFLTELLGYSREQFIDKELWDIGFFKDIVSNQNNFLELQQKQYIRYENLPLETFDGRKVNVEFISNIYLVENKKVIQCNIRDITARRTAEEKIRLLNVELEQLAGTDGLTGIANHRALLKLAEREFDVAMRYQPPLSMMFFDIDHFKQVNDTFGHAIGDEALRLTIQTVCTKLRSADLIGRYGGDEFVILLPQTSAQDALPLAERIHASIAEMRIDTNKGPLTLTISIGIAQSNHDSGASDAVENLLFRADQALYAAKQAGRNRTVLFDERSP